MKLKGQMAELVKDASRESNCHYFFIDGEGKLHNWRNDICFARLNRGTYGIKELRFYVNQHTREGISKRGFFEYARWVTKESAFKDAFKGKYITSKYGMEMDVSKDGRFLFAAMVMIRESWEFPDSLRLWNKLVKDGVNKNIAYLVAFGCQNTSNPDHFISRHRGGHHTFYRISSKSVKNFAQGILEKIVETPASRAFTGCKSTVFFKEPADCHIQEEVNRIATKVAKTRFSEYKYAEYSDILTLCKKLENEHLH